MPDSSVLCRSFLPLGPYSVCINKGPAECWWLDNNPIPNKGPADGWTIISSQGSITTLTIAYYLMLRQWLKSKICLTLTYPNIPLTVILYNITCKHWEISCWSINTESLRERNKRQRISKVLNYKSWGREYLLLSWANQFL